MVRVVLARHAVMTGLAFTVGLLVGLCLHLPAGVSPHDPALLQGASNLPEDGPLHLRRARAVEDAVEGGVMRKIQSAGNGSSPRAVGDHGRWLQEKVKAIEETAASIAAFKGRQNHQQQLQQLDKQQEQQQREQDEQQQNPPHKLSLQAAQSPPLHRKKEVDRAVKSTPGGGDQRQRAPPGGEEPRVYGSRTVSVVVSGRGRGDDLPHPLEDEEEGGDTGQVPVSHHSHHHKETPSRGAAHSRHFQGSDVTSGQGADVTQDEFQTLEDLVSGGVYWSDKMEARVPPGFSDQQVATWRHTVETLKVVRLEEGCGRMQNRRLTLDDAQRACARYRVNTDQMQGEVYSYYLSRLLGIRNLPPTVLSAPDPGSDPRWAEADQAVVRAQWAREKPVVLTPWMDELKPVYIPRELRTPGGRDSTGNLSPALNLHPSRELLANRSLEQLGALVQWSDLLVFDFLTANVDRLVNNMFNLQWNTEMMSAPTHNLEARRHDGLLVFLDNESGLFHSYRLLDKYAHYHDRLLAALCVFRKGTARALRRLARDGGAVRELMNLYRKEEPLAWMLPPIPEANQRTLEARIRLVVDQINRCESRYSSRDFAPTT